MESSELAKPVDKFTLDEVMSSGFDSLKASFWKFFALVALGGFVAMLPSLASFGMGWIGEAYVGAVASFAAQLVLGFLGGILTILMTIGITNVQIKIIRKEPLSSNDLWSTSSCFWSYLGATIIFQLVRCLGFICFIIPGIFVSITFQFYPFFIIEHKMGPIESLKASGDITEGSRWELLFLWIVLGFIKGIGYTILIIGGIPAELYEKLSVTQAYSILLKRNPQVLVGFSSPVNASEQHGLIE